MDKEIRWDNLKEVLRQYAEFMIKALRSNLSSNGSNASFNLSDTLWYETGIEDGSYWVDIDLEDYWYYVENGRKAGKMPPIDKIRQWIIDKPITPRPYTPSVDSLAYVIQRSIRKNKGFAPPRVVLLDWIKKKGITPNPVTPSVDSLAFLIARKIGREGTQGKPFLERAQAEADREFDGRISEAIQDDIALWLETVVADTLKAL